METVTWKCQCFVCKRPIQGGRPCLVFSTERAQFIGVCHSKCSYGLYKHHSHWFQMCPPYHLTGEQASFLVHFHPKLFSLPGGIEPNGKLRQALGAVLHDYPASMNNPMAVLRRSIEEQKRFHPERQYQGDLERDFLHCLGEIQRSARKAPLAVEFDFRPLVW